MVLKIKRERRVQTDRKGRPQGLALILDMRLEVDEAERGLIEAFNLHRHLVHRAEVLLISAEDLVSGWTRDFSDLDLALSIERSVTEGCRELAALMDAARGFEGERAIDLGGQPATP